MEAALWAHACLWLLPAWPPALALHGGLVSGAATRPGELTWAVHLAAPEEETEEEELDRQAEELARAAGLVNVGRVGELRGHYLLGYRPGGSGELAPEDVLRLAEAAFARHAGVKWHAEQRLLKRSKRSLLFNDPKYPQQWHLVRGAGGLLGSGSGVGTGASCGGGGSSPGGQPRASVTAGP